MATATAYLIDDVVAAVDENRVAGDEFRRIMGEDRGRDADVVNVH